MRIAMAQELVILVILLLASGTLGGGVVEILDYVYGPSSEKPVCKQIAGGTPVFTCDNGTIPILKISSFHMSDHPMKPGTVDLDLVTKLTRTVEQGTVLQLQSFKGKNTPVYNGTLDLCESVEFAGYHCPIKPWETFERIQQTLEVPDDVPTNTYSFLATALTRKGELIARIAASIEIDNKYVKEEL